MFLLYIGPLSFRDLVLLPTKILNFFISIYIFVLSSFIQFTLILQTNLFYHFFTNLTFYMVIETRFIISTAFHILSTMYGNSDA